MNTTCSTTDGVSVASLDDEFDEVRDLWQEYATWIGESVGVDLCAAEPEFEPDLADPRARFAPPGAIFLLRVEGRLVGTVGIRAREDGGAELNRFYVSGSARGLGLGRRLLHVALDECRRRGICSLRLETVPAAMGTAVSLYESFGFRTVAVVDDPAGVQVATMAWSADDRSVLRMSA